MIYRKKTKKRQYKKRPMRRKTQLRVGKPLRPAIYYFKRSYSEVVELNTQSPPLGWSVVGNALHRQFIYKLSDLNQYLEFTNLFNQYKITGVRLQMYFNNTVSGQVANVVNTTTPQIVNANNQIIMWLAPNPVGDNTTIGPSDMLNIQSAKKRACINGTGKPINTYCKMKILSNMYGGVGAVDHAITYPRFVSTLEPHLLHYGQNMVLERADQTVFASNSYNYQSVRIIYTYYIATRQVH